jgi:hypothetical protein
VAQKGDMTAKSDFTPEEWKLIQEGPATAGMILISAESGGTFRETFALARAYTDARKTHGESELLDEIAAGKPEFDRHRYKSSEELHDEGLKRIGEAVTLLRSKATTEEVAAYNEFILSAASHVAAAHKEHGQAVSEKEQAALDAVRAQLGAGS